ncbi:hypothetical protein LOK49_LG14G01160 [Camellia lanceoleosa]|uniref:Uncharacterized protein n=1 Tax=Camellia lanceoleosa TaxID=1840588 RepID=A0ACC0F9C8_9ERIC|nr:hypothetical protein LOK49_LG14G01160 [Camellia lanceoleosa]
MNSRGRSNKSLYEKSMEMVVNIIELSSSKSSALLCIVVESALTTTIKLLPPPQGVMDLIVPKNNYQESSHGTEGQNQSGTQLLSSFSSSPLVVVVGVHLLASCRSHPTSVTTLSCFTVGLAVVGFTRHSLFSGRHCFVACSISLLLFGLTPTFV